MTCITPIPSLQDLLVLWRLCFHCEEDVAATCRLMGVFDGPLRLASVTDGVKTKVISADTHSPDETLKCINGDMLPKAFQHTHLFYVSRSNSPSSTKSSTTSPHM